jgi:hypothetical protein
MRLTLSLALLLVAHPAAFASEFERLLLPVAPSVVHCGYESRYDTRLVIFNDGGRRLETLCVDNTCASLDAGSAEEISGEFAGGLPLPLFVYVPRAELENVQMSLMVETSHREKPEERSFTEVPIVRDSDFRDGRMQFIGLRMDPDFRQTVRMFGFDPHAHGQIMMSVYSLETSKLLHSCPHDLWPLSSEVTAEGLAKRPSFGMECDMSDHLPADGNKVRIELEPITPGLKYWALISVTNNTTQHFYTLLPR